MRSEKAARVGRRQGAQQLGTRLIGQQCVLRYATVVVEVAVVAAVTTAVADGCEISWDDPLLKESLIFSFFEKA